jgi:hypothetical protein
MIFLASPKMDLCLYLCSWLSELDSRCSFLIGTLRNVKWLWPRMEQYRSIMNDMGEAIGKIGSECARNLAAKGA